jgi:hypothetical protein
MAQIAQCYDGGLHVVGVARLDARIVGRILQFSSAHPTSESVLALTLTSQDSV